MRIIVILILLCFSMLGGIAHEEKFDSIFLQDQTEYEIEDDRYATAILSSSEFVRNPEEAIGKPDGEFAKIDYWGWLDLEIQVENGDGDDIAVYANRLEGGVQDYRFHHYLVIVKLLNEWRIIGIGGGVTSPEKFDLMDIPSVGMIRIMYRNREEIRQMSRPFQHYPPGGYTMGIDAVEVLNKACPTEDWSKAK